MHRFFFLTDPLAVNQTVDLASIRHQLHSVLRQQAGDRIVLLDGNGRAFITQITGLDVKQGSGLVLERTVVITEPQAYVTLYQCSLKADKFEWVLQKGTELGVSCFVPIISERSIVRPAAALEKKYERWQKILQEAAEQSGRGRIPALKSPQLLAEAVDNAAGLKLLFWEEVATSKDQARLKNMLSEKEAADKISLLIGPEGGLTAAEVDVARAAGWSVASLGPRILRAETAAIAASAIVLDRLG